jgi:hypothetical protein
MIWRKEIMIFLFRRTQLVDPNSTRNGGLHLELMDVDFDKIPNYYTFYTYQIMAIIDHCPKLEP